MNSSEKSNRYSENTENQRIMKNRRRKIQKKKIARDFTLPMNSDLASIREGVVIRLEKNEHTR